ncbi:hypothetical protein [Deinococcus yavapaiensis]|uniref:Cellulase (Glycosyl hydrolase family 5) n=1 Tax=Deinococcus yavapaiensis KR-236 TaxID=694435 RepID=A0A318SGY9_9DEIO|nr:hypothetical protein [Deinococcus yavapaiensis]PYE49911.1 hypothetical protein DES52_12143 [Deinococcus yavapaiensis KR-236]
MHQLHRRRSTRVFALLSTALILASCTRLPTPLPSTSSGNGSTAAPNARRVVATGLTTSGAKLKGSMYWPRKAVNPMWWPEFEDGRLTESDIRADLQQMKRDLGINTVRVFLFYDVEYRNLGTLGFTDGQGHFNDARLATVGRFIDIAASEGLDVLPTLFMEEETNEHGGFNWDTLESNYPYHEAYTRWLVRLLRTKPNVRGVNLKNEPDGFGAWADATTATRILTWMGKLKAAIRQEAPDLQVYVNSAAFDNTFKSFPDAPEGSRSIYELSDALTFNSYLWADNGFWPYAVPATIFRYIQDNNTQRKPVVLSELGWPARDDDNGMIVPNVQWNLPVGTRPSTPSTPEMQKRAVEESVYWAEKFGFEGLIAWAAFDPAPTSYRNPFGLIDENGAPRPASTSFARAFTNQYGTNGEAPVSLYDGRATLGKVNGIDGTTPLPAGVNLDAGGSYFTAPLRYSGSVTFSLRFRQVNVPTSDGLAIGVVNATSGREIQVRREESNRLWRLFVNNVEMARTRSDAGLGTALGTMGIKVDRSALTFTLDGTTLNFYGLSGKSPYTMKLTSSEVSGTWRLMAAASSSPVELLEARALGAAKATY